MAKPRWNIKGAGRVWTKDEAWARFELLPEKNEMFNGQLSWSDEERENVLGLLLELVGADRAVQMGNPQVWRAAVAKLPE
jgi:hypothetical protein